MSNFYIKVFLPHLNQTVSIKTFTNSDFFDLTRFIEANNDEAINEFINQLIRNLLIEKDLFCRINSFEKFIIMLHIYFNYVSPNIVVQGTLTDGGSSSIKIPMEILIGKMYEMSWDTRCEIEIAANTNLILSIPNNLYNSSVYNMLQDMIYKIVSDGQEYFFEEFSEEEKSKFLSSLVIPLMDTASNLFRQLREDDQYTKNIFKLDLILGNIELPQMDISPVDNSLFYFIKSLFNNTIYDLNENMYFFLKSINSDCSHYMTLTPADVNCIIQIHSAQAKRQDEELNSEDPSLNI